MLYHSCRVTRKLPACTPAPRQSLLLSREPIWSVVNPAGSSASRLQGRLKMQRTWALDLHACRCNMPAAGAETLGVQGLLGKACVAFVCSAPRRRWQAAVSCLPLNSRNFSAGSLA